MPTATLTKRVVPAFFTLALVAAAIGLGVLATLAKPLRPNPYGPSTPQWPMFGGTP